jgi:hypothetical protein
VPQSIAFAGQLCQAESAWLFVLICVVAAPGSAGCGFVDRRFLSSVGFLRSVRWSISSPSAGSIGIASGDSQALTEKPEFSTVSEFPAIIRRMREEQKKPGVAFWATVSLVALLLYPLSIGPVIWLGAHGFLPESLEPALVVFYSPVIWAAEDGPAAISRPVNWYADLFD